MKDLMIYYNFKTDQTTISHQNNFDLLRLFAASQVMLLHISNHLEIDIGFLDVVLRQFPGVPIFFTISGFLITMSFDRNKNIKKFFLNRFLRIYPALWVCAIFTLVSLLLFRAISLRELFSKNIILWFLAHISIFQYYTPDILRGWGVGAPNGSLWTIPVEIEFYILLLLIFLLFKKIPRLIKFICLFIVSYMINRCIAPFYNSTGETIFIKLIEVSIFPHLFNFLFGVIMYYFWDKIKKYVENRAAIWISVYTSYIIMFEYIFRLYNPSYYPNIFGFISTMLLSIAIISLAFTNKNIAGKILKNNDISYGIYIYHGPILNIFVNLGIKTMIHTPPPPPTNKNNTRICIKYIRYRNFVIDCCNHSLFGLCFMDTYRKESVIA
jgi:peptidoglycan/LPS O-acetylase OafA/YrhL